MGNTIDIALDLVKCTVKEERLEFKENGTMHMKSYSSYISSMFSATAFVSEDVGVSRTGIPLRFSS